MKKFPTIISAVLLAVIFSLPGFAEAATGPGIKPGNFFYFFDTAFERVGLFFAFSPEKKAEKALRYADERLAEADAVANNADAVKTAVTNYENSIAFAEEKSKDVGDKEKAEALLTAISDNTSKHQETLTNVLAKVPEEAKEAITKAIEVSRRGQEEALRKIAELQGEVEKLKQEIVELKAKDEEREKAIEELNKSKAEKPAAQQKPFVPTQVIPTPKPEQPQTQTQTRPKTSIVTLPSGAVVEIDTKGNILRTIKEVEQQIVSPQYSPQIHNTQSVEEQYYAELLRQQEEKKTAIATMTNEYNQLLQSYNTCLTQGQTISFVVGNCGGLHSRLVDMYYQLILLGATNVQTVPALPGY